MSKGLRLSLYGVTCSVKEIKIISHALGFTESPAYSGWGKGGWRNYFGVSAEQGDADCEALAKKGLMEATNALHNTGIVYYSVTRFGLRWFAKFRCLHPHADWRNYEKEICNG